MNHPRPDPPAPGPLQPTVLPMTASEVEALGWTEIDVLLISGDAYLDHPACGPALLGRWLVAHGYRVGLIAQPRWDEPTDVARLGRPRLFAGVTAGALDSMLAHYTAFRKKRRDDAYTSGGRAGARPNRATIVYTNLVKQAFPGLPVVLGGIEASLRRVAHYDFWSDSLRRPILFDAKADLLIYGMGERAVLDVARGIEAGQPVALRSIPGIAFIGRMEDIPTQAPVVTLPAFEDIQANPRALLEATLALEGQVHQRHSWAVQAVGHRWLLLAPPARPLTTAEMDFLYNLPFSRRPHPSYREALPVAKMLAESITTHRGCGGGCSFCSLALHQGRLVTSRSLESILTEVQNLTRRSDWSGSLSDVGGPSANMWGARCGKTGPPCRRPSCLFPAICRHFHVDQAAWIELLRRIKAAGVRHVRVASGLRFDLALRDRESLKKLLREFVGGQLKVAPEHISPGVLGLMRKPGVEVFEEFLRLFSQESRLAGKKQFVVPYLLSGFPGCSEADMDHLAAWLAARDWRPRQVQCFVPTPGTVATAMFHSGRAPDGRAITVARSDAARLAQHGRLKPAGGDEG